ncbi:unnamed protein product [Soboliphyme baturini]|uniref:Uncharacterized protein n=1 Tax=Soboliphyme baturini TaxID=241478 RepID=A0A183IFR5_9BILA|nr:unnamed protein product [Soboliphyme baturini]
MTFVTAPRSATSCLDVDSGAAGGIRIAFVTSSLVNKELARDQQWQLSSGDRDQSIEHLSVGERPIHLRSNGNVYRPTEHPSIKFSTSLAHRSAPVPADVIHDTD